MDVFEVHFPPIALEANTPLEAVAGAVKHILAGKVQVPVGAKARILFGQKVNKGPASPQMWWPMGKMAQILCPNGHNVTLLADNHTIRDNGEVTPSVICGHDGCPFHAHIQLIGWPP